MEAGWIPGTDRILRVAWIPETAERRFLLTRTMLTESGRSSSAAAAERAFFPSRTMREILKQKTSDSTKQRLPFQGSCQP